MNLAQHDWFHRDRVKNGLVTARTTHLCRHRTSLPLLHKAAHAKYAWSVPPGVVQGLGVGDKLQSTYKHVLRIEQMLICSSNSNGNYMNFTEILANPLMAMDIR